LGKEQPGLSTIGIGSAVAVVLLITGLVFFKRMEREVAGSFRDPRVTHIRNERNLGHLKNNKGIHLARGEYIWLISADDSLRSRVSLSSTSSSWIRCRRSAM